jgi:hypothetical protein
MTDVWVCSTCHSINRQRGARCYKCGAKRDKGADVLPDARTDAAIPTLASVPPRRSVLRAIVAAALRSRSDSDPAASGVQPAPAPVPDTPPEPPAEPVTPSFAPRPAAEVWMDAGGDGPAAPGTGPRLTVTVGADAQVVAEIDGESEVVSLDDLQDAAAALAWAGGSAVITTTGKAANARWAAREIARSLRDSGVPTDFED